MIHVEKYVPNVENILYYTPNNVILYIYNNISFRILCTIYNVYDEEESIRLQYRRVCIILYCETSQRVVHYYYYYYTSASTYITLVVIIEKIIGSFTDVIVKIRLASVHLKI